MYAVLGRLYGHIIQQAAWGPLERPGEFGVLYLNQTIQVAATQVRHMFRSGEATVFDLRPERRPELLELEVEEGSVLDAVTDAGLMAIGLPTSYPHEVGHAACQPIGRLAYQETDLAGIACRSAAGCEGPAEWVGEALGLFDREAGSIRAGSRRTFAEWFSTAQAR